MSNGWKHDDLATDLAGYLRETKGVMTWEDMQLGPSGSPRPDVFTMRYSYTKCQPLAYECKISVSDFRSDVTSGKWQSYLPYASAVIFAVPAGLITKADIPDGCGLIVRHENCWRMAKAPTLQKLDNLPRDFWLKMMMDGVKRQGELARVESRSPYMAGQALTKRWGEDVAALLAEAQRNRDVLRQLTDREREQGQRIRQRLEKEERDAVEGARRKNERLTRVQQELAEELGLARDASVNELIDALREARRRLVEDNELQSLRSTFGRILDMAEQCTKPLPGERPEVSS